MEPVQTLSSEQLGNDQVLTPSEPLAYWSTPADTREERVQRFLKVLLPSLPIVAFSVDFLYAHIVQASADMAANRPVNEVRPFLGALLVALVVSLLCVFIYHGVLKILDETQQDV